jgi:hypothetical protein
VLESSLSADSLLVLGVGEWVTHIEYEIVTSSIHFDRNLNCELWLGMLFVDLLEPTLNLQQNRAFVVTFSATQTNFTRYVPHHEIVAVSPINVLDSALFKIGITTTVSTCLCKETYTIVRAIQQDPMPPNKTPSNQKLLVALKRVYSHLEIKLQLRNDQNATTQRHFEFLTGHRYTH